MAEAGKDMIEVPAGAVFIPAGGPLITFKCGATGTDAVVVAEEIARCCELAGPEGARDFFVGTGAPNEASGRGARLPAPPAVAVTAATETGPDVGRTAALRPFMGANREDGDSTLIQSCSGTKLPVCNSIGEGPGPGATPAPTCGTAADDIRATVPADPCVALGIEYPAGTIGTPFITIWFVTPDFVSGDRGRGKAADCMWTMPSLLVLLAASVVGVPWL